MEFIPAKNLKERFITFGSYYKISARGLNRSIPCRNTLEIYSKGLLNSIKDARKPFVSRPDLLVIMMNPGSSKPIESTSCLKTSVESIADRLAKNRLVIARPDRTQYQIMRVMLSKGWEHARIINLSDIREPKSNIFLRKLAEFDTLGIGTAHSIFDRRRVNELKEALDLKKTSSPIVVAWGVNKGLKPLAKLSLNSLSDYQIYGLGKDPELLLYLHPSPRDKYSKMSWLSGILNKLSSCQ